MAQRPSSQQARREWAESADADDVSEPSTERPKGFQFEQDLDHDQVNWLMRELFRWVDWLDELFQRGADGGTPGAIDLLQSVLVGDHGDFLASQDDSSVIGVLFEHEGTGDAQWVSDILRATIRMASDILSPVSGDFVDVRGAGALGDSGSGGFKLSELRGKGETSEKVVVIQAEGSTEGDGRVKLSRLVQNGNNELIEVWGDGSAQSGDEGIELGRIRAINDQPVQLKDSNRNLEYLDARNTSIVECTLYWDAGNSSWKVDGRNVSGVSIDTLGTGYPRIDIQTSSSYLIREAHITDKSAANPATKVPYSMTAVGEGSEIGIVLQKWNGSGWNWIGDGSTSNGSAPSGNPKFHVTAYTYIHSP